MKNVSATISLNNMPSSSTEDLPSKAEGIALCSAFAVEAVFIVVGNLLTIVLFAVNGKLRKKSLFVVINMAFADLMLGAVSLPVYIYGYVGASYLLWTARLKLSFRLFFSFADNLFSQASLISATLISVERFYAIYWPLKHRTLSTRAYRLVIFMTWILAILVSTAFSVLLHFISLKHAVYVASPLPLTLLFVVCGLNIGIWRKFQQGSIASQQQNRASQNQRLTKTLLFVSVVALMSWLPLIIGNFLLALVYPVSMNFRSFYFIIGILNYSNSFINIVVYALRIPEFKQALGLHCFRRQAVMNTKGNKKSENRAAKVQNVASRVNMACEQDIMDTSL